MGMRKTLTALLIIALIVEATAQNNNVGFGTTTPDASSLLELESTTQGFLPPRMTASERDNIANPVAGLIIYQKDGAAGLYEYSSTGWVPVTLVPNATSTGEILYWNGTEWLSLPGGSEGQILSLNAGIPRWTTFGGVTAIGEVLNPTTGKTWMDRNLGASQVATSSADAAAYGDLYQWGRGTDGHQLRTSGITTTTSSSDNPGHGDFIIIVGDWRNPKNDSLWQGVTGINNPCPSGYRLPTDAEWLDEVLSWSSFNAAGALASPLKLPLGGSRSSTNGSIVSAGANGLFWSSTVAGTNSRSLAIASALANLGNNNRAFGMSVRCIKD